MRRGVPCVASATSSQASSLNSGRCAPRHGQPVVDIADHLLAAEQGEMEIGGDALHELAQRWAGEQLLELRLAAQHHLQQLAVMRVDVGDHAQLLERMGAKILRLVDDQHRALAQLMLPDEEALEISVQADIGLAFERLVEGHQHPFEQFAAAFLGVGQQADINVAGQLVEQVPDQRGLAGSDFSSDDRKAGMADDTVFEHGKGQPMRISPVKKPGIGHHGKWPGLQAEKRFVHGRPR